MCLLGLPTTVLVHTVFFGYKMEFFPNKKNRKYLDPSYKTGLDLWDCLGRVNMYYSKCHRTDVVICSYFREGKPRLYAE